jgi:hypothetical protein
MALLSNAGAFAGATHLAGIMPSYSPRHSEGQNTKNNRKISKTNYVKSRKEKFMKRRPIAIVYQIRALF